MLNLYLGYAVAVRLGRYARPLPELPVEPEPTVEPDVLHGTREPVPTERHADVVDDDRLEEGE